MPSAIWQLATPQRHRDHPQRRGHSSSNASIGIKHRNPGRRRRDLDALGQHLQRADGPLGQVNVMSAGRRLPV
jgi:hypothetical protein